MKSIFKYSILIILFALISSGVVVAAFVNSPGPADYRVFWLLIPMTLLFMGAVFVNDGILVPRFLLRRKFGLYLVLTFCLAYAVPLTALAVEWFARGALHMPERLHNPLSPWILLDSLSNSILLLFILLGLAAWRLYIVWDRQALTEGRIAESLSSYISTVKNRLNPTLILSRVDEIITALDASDRNANFRIRALSDYLRHQLYELPEPPDIPLPADSPDASSHSASFIYAPRFRWARVVIFQFIIILTACGAIFDTPDHPVFDMQHLSGVVALWAFLNILAAVNILWLFRSFRRNHNVGRYLRNVILFILALILPMIAAQFLTYSQNPYDKHLPLFVMILSAAGSSVTMILYISGITAYLLLKDWLLGRRRLTLLRAETLRQEYAFLKKQINPHFLFNVLNNAGILSDDDPREAADMLRELRRILEYQFDGTVADSTPLTREISFLRTYLSLESSRIEALSFSLEAPEGLDGVRVPTLLFIPFVENAVKHSGLADGRRHIEISFRIEGNTLHFISRNTCAPRTENRPGGLGLANTRRRLELLFSTRYTLTLEKSRKSYLVGLTIPLS